MYLPFTGLNIVFWYGPVSFRTPPSRPARPDHRFSKSRLRSWFRWGAFFILESSPIIVAGLYLSGTSTLSLDAHFHTGARPRQHKPIRRAAPVCSCGNRPRSRTCHNLSSNSSQWLRYQLSTIIRKRCRPHLPANFTLPSPRPLSNFFS